MKRYWVLMRVVAVFLFVTACTGSGNNAAAQAVEIYLQALADKNLDQMIAVSCGDWEAQAHFELDTYVGVETRLEGVSCQVSSTDGETASVTCVGKMVASYGAEDRDFPFDDPFQVVQEGGEWRVCGHP